jgi:D-cysteine desulfhydrase
MARLRQALGGGPRLLIKRDDQTGLATGGNKTRKLEFVLADALAQGTDIVVTGGGPQSNHSRQTAAAAAKLGLRCVLCLSGDPQPPPTWQGNLLLDGLLGAEIRWTGPEDPAQAMVATARILEAEGAKPYVIPIGASIPLGATGYVAAVEEVVGQLEAQDTKIDRIIFASGSAGTQAGILVGVKALNWPVKVEGVSDGADPAGMPVKIKALAAETAAFLGLDIQVTDADLILHASYGRPGYGVITTAEREAIHLLARTEGIITDPVYTGRTLAGLLDRVRRGIYADGETILYWHTGGVAGLFARATEMLVD